jgi:hypothetical protein
MAGNKLMLNCKLTEAMILILSKLDRQFYLTIPALILTLWLNIPVESQSIDRYKMFQTKKTKVAAGKWGGTGIGLSVGETDVSLEFDCATAEIARNLMIDKAGNFSAEGFYIRRSPGALRTKFPPKRAAARFVGKISGKTMTLRITLIETDEKIGDFTLQRGKTSTIRKCA